MMSSSSRPTVALLVLFVAAVHADSGCSQTSDEHRTAHKAVYADLQAGDFLPEPGINRCPPDFYIHQLPFDDQSSDSREQDLQEQKQQTLTDTLLGHNPPTAVVVCRRCSICPVGKGAVRPCGHRYNAICEPCQPGLTFSDQASSNQPCLECSRCGGPNAEIGRNCTVRRDTACLGCRRGYFFNTLTGECQACGYCYPDHPGLTQTLPACSVHGQSKLYRCIPVFNPPYPAPTLPDVEQADSGKRSRRRRVRHGRRRFAAAVKRRRTDKIGGKRRRDGESVNSVLPDSN